jgi:predicted Zn-dependent protease
MGGARNRIAFFSHHGVGGWQITVSDPAILDDPLLARHSELAAVLKRAKGGRNLGLLALVALAAMFLSVPLVIVSQAGRITRGIANSVPTEWEQELGETAFESLNPAIIDDEASLAALGALVAHLELPEGVEWQFHIVEDAEPNAFALPGGIVAVHTGLLAAAETGDEVIAVLCHELAHVNEQHGIRLIMQSAGTFVLLSAVSGDATGALGLAASAAPLLLTPSFSRDFEREADAGALPCMDAAGVDPAAMARMFEHMDAHMEQVHATISGSGEEIAEGILAWIGTHPQTDERIEFFEAASSGGAYNDYRGELEALQSALEIPTQDQTNQGDQ